MTLKPHVVGRVVVGVLAYLALRGSAGAVTVNFDTLAAGAQPGNALASSGVNFTTGTVPDAVMVDDVITLTGPDPQFDVLAQPANAVSPPNFATARGAGLNDVLMSFATPVTSVSIRTDHFSPESADVVRLLALAATGNPNQFRVLAISEGFDDAVSAPADTLSVGLGTPFSFALFQTTTEPEGFDDLTFFVGPVGAPSLNGWGIALLTGLLVLLGARTLGGLHRAT